MNKKRKMKVYIASPYTHGDIGVNVKTNMDTAILLADTGYVPFAPLLTHFLHLAHPRSYEYWVEYDNEWVEVCDIVLRLPGYSKGADAEVALAEKLHIPVVYTLEELDTYRSEVWNGPDKL